MKIKKDIQKTIAVNWGQVRRLCSRIVFGLAIASALVSTHLEANPTGATIVNGTVGIDTSMPGVTNITNSPNAIINWQGFSIGQNEITRFIQQSSQSSVLNRVIGGNPSQIMGQLLSNGQVYLINPNGLLFGAGSVIDTAGFLGSSLNLSNADYLSGNYHFIAGADAGDINNEGIIRTGQDGNIVLIAPNIENSGIISTDGGKITLAAGEELTITSLDDPRIRFQIQAPDNAILNVGEVLANGGAIDLFAGTITHSGAISANSVEVDEQGVVWLRALDDITLNLGSNISANNTVGDAGRVTLETLGRSNVDGEENVDRANIYQQGIIEAVGLKGGSIFIYADSMLSSNTIAANGESVGGDIRINLAERLLATQDGKVSADASLGVGGTIDIRAGDRIFSSAKYSATGGAGGGRIVLTASEVKLADASIDVSGDRQGGSIRVGGGFHGSELSITNAENTYISSATVLSADAVTEGNGGSVVVWADGQTSFGGTITARGGSESGNGGTAEVSGKGALGYSGFADLTASNGEAGTLLLDPTNLTVTQGSVSSNVMVTFSEWLDPNPGAGDRFGNNYQTLTNQFHIDLLAIRQPDDDFSGTDAGALYIFDKDVGTLLYTLTGANAGDQIGNNSINILVNGNYLLRSTIFNSSAGAATWFFGGAGINGVVSAANSLVGSNPNDRVGNSYNSSIFLLESPYWGNNQGAWTWFNPNTGLTAGGLPLTGAITAANSLVGGTGGDTVGTFVSRTFLGSSANALAFPGWDAPGTSPVIDAGAVSLFNASTGKFLDGSDFIGTIGAINSIVGSNAGDQVGWQVDQLARLIISPFWGNNQGAWTWFDLANGNLADGQFGGVVSAANSLVGGTGGDTAGSFANTTSVGANKYALYNGNWDAPGTSPVIDAGAMTLFNTGSGTFLNGLPMVGAISSSNSLVGSLANDRVGSNAPVALVSGTSYLLSSPNWSNNQGAWTWFNSASNLLVNGEPVEAAINASNSLVGGTGGDTSGSFAYTQNLVPALGGTRFALVNSGWDGDTLQNAGAVTLFDGLNGTFVLGDADFAGSISGTNSLVGSSVGDQVGAWGLESVGTSYYIVNSPYWGGNQGAWTWFDAATGELATGNGFGGAVSAGNSLVGGTADTSGSFAFTQSLGNGIYALVNDNWDSGAAQNAGAVTLFTGNSGSFFAGGDLIGPVGSGNSLVGSNAGDRVGYDIDGVGGAYLVMSPYWDGNQGAWTWFDPLTGLMANGQALSGAVSAANSLVGGTPGDTSGSFAFVQNFGSGNYGLINQQWDAAGALDAGAVTLFDGGAGTFHTALGGAPLLGMIDSSNSLVGSSTGDNVGDQLRSLAGGAYLVMSPLWGGNQGAWTWFHPGTGMLANGQPFASVINAANSLVGGTAGDTSGSFAWTTTFGGTITALINDDWDAPGAQFNAGAVTLIDGTNGAFHATLGGGALVGTIDSSNSLVGSSIGDRVGYDYDFVGGGSLLMSPYWGDNQGAWTWFRPLQGVLANGQPFAGVVGASNSLVGGTPGDTVGAFPWTTNFGMGIYALVNDDWDAPGAQLNAGAVTLLDGDLGTFIGGANLVGTISSANSLVGSSSGDRVGYDWGFVGGGGYLWMSPFWGDNQGAWTWFDSDTGLLANGQPFKGAVGASNSLVGGTSGDTSGSFAWTTNFGSGTYALINEYWDAPGAQNAGAITLFTGVTGTLNSGGNLVGTISSTNSLVGSSDGDRVGYDYDWVGGGYLWTSPYWGNNQGAWTWFNPVTNLLANGQAFVGTIGSNNSLVGGTGGDTGGSFVALRNLGNNIYALVNQYWDSPTTLDAGAMTLLDGAAGTFLDGAALVGSITSANSLIGAATGDFWNNNFVTLTSNSRYGLFLPDFDTTAGVDAGRIFIIDIVAGPVSGATNTLFGDSAGSDLSVTNTAIEVTLNAGTNLLLQASNDLLVSAPITVNNTGGNGGALTLEAGRDLLINASIFTDNGNFFGLANSTGADGAFRSAGLGDIIMAGGTSINAGTGSVSLTIDSGLSAGAAGAFDLINLIANSINLIYNGAGGLPNNGILSLSPGSTTTINGALANSGTIDLGAGSTLIVTGGITNTGILSGFGTLQADVLNQAFLRPGASPGALTISGDLTLANTSTTVMDITGLTQGTQYDFINVIDNPITTGTVEGNVSLDGLLNILTTSYTGEAVGDSFNFIQASGTLSGSFSSVTTTTGYSYNTTIIGNILNLLATAIPSITNTNTAAVQQATTTQTTELVSLVEQSTLQVVDQEPVVEEVTEEEAVAEATVEEGGGIEPVSEDQAVGSCT